MTFILLYVVAPCLIVNSMQVDRSAEMLASIGIAAIASVLTFGVGIFGVMLLFRKQEPDTRDVLRFGSMYPNCGFMGFPLVKATLGDEAVIYASIFLIIFTLVHWTHGVVLMGGRKNASLKSALINPGTTGFVLGMILLLTGIKLPWPIGNAVNFIAEINTPLAMFVIGAQMADADILKVLRIKELYAASAAKLIAFPLGSLLVLFVMGLFVEVPPLVFSSVVILSATSCAGVTAMFAEQYNRDAVTGARLVTLTTLLSIITLPVFAVIAQQLAGI